MTIQLRICSICSQPFGFGKRADAKFCSNECYQKNYADHRRVTRYRNCLACGIEFYIQPVRGYSNKLYCSALCYQEQRNEKERRRERSGKRSEATREHRRAYDREYLKLHPGRGSQWYRDNPGRRKLRRKLEPSYIKETMAAAARIKARREARNRRTEIMEAARQADAWRWQAYGVGLSKDARALGRPSVYTTDEQREEARKRVRRKRRVNEKAALKIYRELVGPASRKDRRLIYQALKAELPTLNLNLGD